MTNFGTEVVKGNREALTTKDQPNLKVRLMCFTSFSENEPVFTNKMKWLCFGTEVCPTTGKHHYQGVVYWHNACWTYAVRKRWKCKVFACNGDVDDNEIYCKKDNQWKEFGEKPKQGFRSDLIDIRDKIIAGTTVDEITMENPMLYHQYGRTLEKIEDIVQRDKIRTEMTTCDWYYGKTGCNKSRTAYANFTVKTHYNYPYDGGWWDGYKGQDTVIFDEFRGQLAYNELLRLIDIHPNYACRRRGREPINFTSKHVIITSALHPKDIYFNLSSSDSLDQLYRRIRLIPLKK